MVRPQDKKPLDSFRRKTSGHISVKTNWLHITENDRGIPRQPAGRAESSAYAIIPALFRRYGRHGRPGRGTVRRVIRRLADVQAHDLAGIHHGHHWLRDLLDPGAQCQMRTLQEDSGGAREGINSAGTLYSQWSGHISSYCISADISRPDPICNRRTTGNPKL